MRNQERGERRGEAARREQGERGERGERETARPGGRPEESLLPDGNANPSPGHEPEVPSRTTPA